MEKSRNNIDDMTLNVSVKNGIKYAKDNFRKFSGIQIHKCNAESAVYRPYVFEQDNAFLGSDKSNGSK